MNFEILRIDEIKDFANFKIELFWKIIATKTVFYQVFQYVFDLIIIYSIFTSSFESIRWRHGSFNIFEEDSLQKNNFREELFREWGY